jgi:predicted methyltransferase
MEFPMIRNSRIFAVSLALSLSYSAAQAQAARIPANIQSAVADSARPDEDRQRDADRKPAETLSFAGIKPGESVGEIFPGGGYFMRIFSVAVGPKGHVYALVPELPANANSPDFAAKARAIAGDPHYSNASVVVAGFDALVPPVPVDVIFTAQNYHDLHNVRPEVASFNKMIFKALKPGGLYVVLDHSAESGSGLRDTKTLHRIDSDAVKKEILDAGFEFVGASAVLANAADPRTVKVFDPSVRGKTDQFILKFRKPKR